MLTDSRLRVFMMVASEGSFTRAAQHLGISQPAVSQNIAELERQVGVSLFSRQRGDVFLTPEGEVFKDYASRVLKEYASLDALFGSGGKFTVNRPVQVAATDFTATHFLPALLKDLLAMTSTAFTVRTFPESDFPDGMEADLYLFTASRRDTLDFDAGSVIGVVPAALVTAGAAFPEEPRFAVWGAYRPLVSQEMYAQAAVISDDLPGLLELVRANANLVGVVPSRSASGLVIQPDPLPHLQLDLPLRIADAFAGTGIAAWLSSRYA